MEIALEVSSRKHSQEHWESSEQAAQEAEEIWGRAPPRMCKMPVSWEFVVVQFVQQWEGRTGIELPESSVMQMLEGLETPVYYSAR